jgi:thiamine-monophosphate kinase
MPDELEVIRAIVKAASRLPAGYAKIGDDVSLIPTGGRKLVLKVDMLVERTDMPKGMSYRQAARKAVAMCVSDFAAKGVKPDSFMVSLGLRQGTMNVQVEELARGFRDAADEWGVKMVGGDTNEAGELVIDCVMAGFATRVVERSGASPGDILVVTGPFGFPPAGLKILGEGATASARFRQRAVRSVLSPDPSLKVGIALAPYLSSSIDSSDGLARSIHTLAGMSGVGFELDFLPTGEGVHAFARKNGLDASELVLNGGEEYVIVGTIRPANLGRAEDAVRRAGGRLTTIGRATGRKGSVLLLSGGSERPIPDEGWTHLRRG